MPKSACNSHREAKSDTIRRLLTQKSGADIAQLQDATGWQSHSVRAAISRLRKVGYTIDRLPPKADGARGGAYRISAAPDQP